MLRDESACDAPTALDGGRDGDPALTRWAKLWRAAGAWGGNGGRRANSEVGPYNCKTRWDRARPVKGETKRARCIVPVRKKKDAGLKPAATKDAKKKQVPNPAMQGSE